MPKAALVTTTPLSTDNTANSFNSFSSQAAHAEAKHLNAAPLLSPGLHGAGSGDELQCDDELLANNGVSGRSSNTGSIGSSNSSSNSSNGSNSEHALAGQEEELNDFGGSLGGVSMSEPELEEGLTPEEGMGAHEQNNSWGITQEEEEESISSPSIGKGSSSSISSSRKSDHDKLRSGQHSDEGERTARLAARMLCALAELQHVDEGAAHRLAALALKVRHCSGQGVQEMPSAFCNFHCGTQEAITLPVCL